MALPLTHNDPRPRVTARLTRSAPPGGVQTDDVTKHTGATPFAPASPRGIAVALNLDAAWLLRLRSARVAWRRWLLQRRARAAIRRGEGCVIAHWIAAGRWHDLASLEAE